MKVKFHRALPNTEAYYEDATSRKWRRLTGGIGWPQPDRKGVALVLAESLEEPAHYRVMDSIQDYNAFDLIGKSKALEADWLVKSWHGDPTDAAMMLLVYEFNRDKYPEEKLRFLSAPLAGQPHNSGYYLPKLIDLVMVGQERLNAAAVPEVKAAIESIVPDVHLNRNIAEFPALAALCYPLSWMMLYKGRASLIQKIDYAKYQGDAWQL